MIVSSQSPTIPGHSRTSRPFAARVLACALALAFIFTQILMLGAPAMAGDGGMGASPCQMTLADMAGADGRHDGHGASAPDDCPLMRGAVCAYLTAVPAGDPVAVMPADIRSVPVGPGIHAEPVAQTISPLDRPPRFL